MIPFECATSLRILQYKIIYPESATFGVVDPTYFSSPLIQDHKTLLVGYKYNNPKFFMQRKSFIF